MCFSTPTRRINYQPGDHEVVEECFNVLAGAFCKPCYEAGRGLQVSFIIRRFGTNTSLAFVGCKWFKRKDGKHAHYALFPRDLGFDTLERWELLRDTLVANGFDNDHELPHLAPSNPSSGFFKTSESRGPSDGPASARREWESRGGDLGLSGSGQAKPEEMDDKPKPDRFGGFYANLNPCAFDPVTSSEIRTDIVSRGYTVEEAGAEWLYESCAPLDAEAAAENHATSPCRLEEQALKRRVDKKEKKRIASTSGHSLRPIDVIGELMAENEDERPCGGAGKRRRLTSSSSQVAASSPSSSRQVLKEGNGSKTKGRNAPALFFTPPPPSPPPAVSSPSARITRGRYGELYLGTPPPSSDPSSDDLPPPSLFGMSCSEEKKKEMGGRRDAKGKGKAVLDLTEDDVE